MKDFQAKIARAGSLSAVIAALFSAIDLSKDHIKAAWPWITEAVFTSSLVIFVVCTVIATACGLAYVVIGGNNKIIEKPDTDWMTSPCELHEVHLVHLIARQDITNNISEEENTKRCLRKNKFCFYTLRGNYSYENGKTTSEFLGYFCAFPLTEDATNKILSAELMGKNIDHQHITTELESPYSIYIGGIAGKTTYAKGLLMRDLVSKLTDAQKGGVKLFMARGTTTDGIRKLDRHKFVPIREDNKVALYVLKY